MTQGVNQAVRWVDPKYEAQGRGEKCPYCGGKVVGGGVQNGPAEKPGYLINLLYKCASCKRHLLRSDSVDVICYGDRLMTPDEVRHDNEKRDKDKHNK